MAEAKKAPSMPTFMQYVRLLDLASAAMMTSGVLGPGGKPNEQEVFAMLLSHATSMSIENRRVETRTDGVFCLNRRTSSSFSHTRKDGPQAGTAVRF